MNFDGFDLRKAVGEAVGDADIDVPCPECEANNTVKAKHVAEQRTIRCNGCGKDIKLIDEGGNMARVIRGQ